MQPISLSNIAQSLTPTLLTEVLVILSADQPLNEQVLGLIDWFNLLRTEQMQVSPELIAEATAAYEAFHAAASPELQAWLQDAWVRADVGQYVGVEANVAWAQINVPQVPTAVGGGAVSAEASSIWVVLALFLALFGSLSLVRRR